MRIAVTGHMDVVAECASSISEAILAELPNVTFTGVSCIARGADSIFAEAVLDAGGSLEVILPSPNYRARKVKPDHLEQFDQLISRADRVRELPYEEVDRDAYEAANEVLVNECDMLFAVWDGQTGERSGTASVVEYAQARDLPVTVIWPAGAARAGG